MRLAPEWYQAKSSSRGMITALSRRLSNFKSDTIILKAKLATFRLHGILAVDVLPFGE